MKINLSNLRETLSLNTSATSSGYFWSFILVSRDARILLNVTLLFLLNYICLFVCSFFHDRSLVHDHRKNKKEKAMCIPEGTWFKISTLFIPWLQFFRIKISFKGRKKKKDDPCLSLTRERRCHHDPFKALPNF